MSTHEHTGELALSTVGKIPHTPQTKQKWIRLVDKVDKVLETKMFNKI